MIDLRSAADVRKVTRQAFGAAAGIDPNTITDAASIFDPPPPADNLNLTPVTVRSLIEASGRDLIGAKIGTFFARDLVPPEALLVKKFGPLADLLHVHFNSLVLSAVFLTICDGLAQNPRDIGASTPITHLDEAGRLTFMMRVRDSVRDRMCNRGNFEFTMTRGTSLMDARNVEAAMDATVGGLKDAMPGDNCI
jgi:hypothetical protein